MGERSAPTRQCDCRGTKRVGRRLARQVCDMDGGSSELIDPILRKFPVLDRHSRTLYPCLRFTCGMWKNHLVSYIVSLLGLVGVCSSAKGDENRSFYTNAKILQSHFRIA